MSQMPSFSLIIGEAVPRPSPSHMICILQLLPGKQYLNRAIKQQKGGVQVFIITEPWGRWEGKLGKSKKVKSLQRSYLVRRVDVSVAP